MSTTRLQAEFFKYALVGGVAFVADFAVLALLVSGLGLHYLIATVLAFGVGIWVNYQLSVHWVFGFRALDHRGAEFGLFLAIGVLTLLASVGLMALLVNWAGWHYLLAKCATAAFTLLANFALRRLLLFTDWRSRFDRSA